MAYNETGHAMNVAAFGTATVTITEFGERYNPSNPIITVQSMNNVNDQLHVCMKDVKEIEAGLSNMIKNRQMNFDKLPPLITRLMGAVDSSAIIGTKKASLRNLAKRIYGHSKKTGNSSKVDNGGIKYSTSRMSYVMRIDNLEKLAAELEQLPEYDPGDENLKPAGLKALAATMKENNNAINSMTGRLAKARDRRDLMLYAVEKGAADLLKMVKSYIKSWPDGTKGIEFKRINSIKIKRLKKY